MHSDQHYRDEIIHIGWLLHERQYVVATDGNISVRLDHDSILATPTAVCKGRMSPEDLVVVDNEGKRKSGTRNASSEIAMHLLIYRLRPDVRAVVHAHPPQATGFAVAGCALDEPLLAEAVVCLGSVPLAPYATPGTPELPESIRPWVPDYDAILMSNHGVVTYAEDLEAAYMKMEIVEHLAKITLVARMLGSPRCLTVEEIAKLKPARLKYLGVLEPSRSDY